MTSEKLSAERIASLSELADHGSEQTISQGQLYSLELLLAEHSAQARDLEQLRAAARALERKGLVRSAGTVAKCDGDGFLVQPGRWCEGFKLTAKGLALLIERDNNDAKVIAKLKGATP